MDPYARMKQGMRWMWSLGDYSELAPILEPAAHAIVQRCNPGPGTGLLDVAGTGNVALLAARRGARVIACDLTPRMIDLGRARSEGEGLDIVAKPGGLVAMANYTEAGFFGRLGSVVASSAPSESLPPSPLLWADPATVHTRFEGLTSDVRVERRSATFEFESIERGWILLERSNGPLNALQQVFPPETYANARRRVLDLMAELNRADDGRLVIDWTYALVLATRAPNKLFREP